MKESEKIPLWLWASAVVPRLALLAVAFFHPERALRADSGPYLELAANLLRKGAFIATRGGVLVAETFRTPGYPLLLLPFQLFSQDAGIIAAAALQCLLGAVAPLILWRALRRAGFGAGAAVAAAVLALDPVLVLHTPLLLTEAPFAFFLTVVLAWMISAPEQVLTARTGLFWGLCTFIKPGTLFYLPAPALLLGRGRRAILVFLAAAFFLPAAWTVRNRLACGHAVYTSQNGTDSMRYVAANVVALGGGLTRDQGEDALRAAADAKHPGGYLDEVERSQAYGREARGAILRHPLRLVRLCATGAVKQLGGHAIEMWLDWAGRRDEGRDTEIKAGASGAGTRRVLSLHPALWPVMIATLLWLAALYALALRGFIRLWRGGQGRLALFLASGALYFLAITSALGYYRYRLPMLPFLAVLAGAAFPFSSSAMNCSRPPKSQSAAAG